MTAPAITPYRSAAPGGHDGFVQLLWAEWTKFRTVRGWVAGMIIAGLLTFAVALAAAVAAAADRCAPAACSRS